MNQRFIENIQKLDFYPANEKDHSFLLTSQKPETSLTPIELFGLEEARKFDADAVYFRHFSDGRAAIPQIYFYDNTTHRLQDDELAGVHRNLWSSCRIPMFIEMRDTEFAVYDARKPVTVLPDGTIKTESISDTINLISEIVHQYSRFRFDTGVFWESEPAKNHFLESTSAYRDFIDNLKTVRKEFLKSGILPEKIANKLLVYSILIKYLEERGNEGERLFARGFFRQFGAENFCEALKGQGQVIRLFDKLSEHFNGRIFEWTSDEERKAVGRANLEQLAHFLYGEIDLRTGQYSFWRRYSFKHLPVELISSVYEEFLNQRNDAVYTPEFLVNTLIDEAMPPRDYETLSVKTIDVSCGSGIFLVSAFKRLAERHRYAKFKKTGNLGRLKSKELLKIVKNNLFGVDIEEEAVRLTVFSLCLALCDELTPMEIWTDLKFDDTFQKNFVAQSFFSYLQSADLATFDLVIGNAPFEELGHKPTVYNDILESCPDVRINSEHGVYPKKQIALMFLDQSPRLLKEGGLLCLIVPAAPLLYNNTIEFRRHFFSRHHVQQILDFTNLDDYLFERSNVPTAAVFMRKQDITEDDQISHVTIHRTKSVEERLFFEIDKYDFHFVSHQSAMNDKHVWKTNLLGGGRLHGLIQRLSGLRTVGQFIKEKGWISGVGYEVGSPPKQIKPAQYITGQPTLPTRAFTERGIDMHRIQIETAEKFHRISDERLFSPPHLLIKKNIGFERIPTYFSDEYLTFKDSILGIADPQSNSDDLKEFSTAFETHKSIYRLFIAATSNEYLVGRATTILNQDVKRLPYPSESSDLKLSFIEQTICSDVLKYQIEMLAKGSRAKANWQKATNHDLKGFGNVFCRMLNSIYGKSAASFFFKTVYAWDKFFIAEFSYGKQPTDLEFKTLDQPSEKLNRLIEDKYDGNAHRVRILKLYERNKVYFIKPNNLRFWLQSAAIKDADEVFSDSLLAGYALPYD